MGQANSTLQVHVQLEQGCLHAGDVVRGTAYLVAKQAVEVTKLVVKVEGNETCDWGMGSKRNKHEFFKEEASVLSNAQLAPGLHQFPFKIALPQQLPGTFTYTSSDARAAITYKAKLCVDWVEWSRVCSQMSQKQTKEFTIRERRRAPSRPVFIQEAVALSHHGKLKGVVRWELALPTNACTPGEEQPLAFRFKVTNHAGVIILGIQAELVQHMMLKSRSGDLYSKDTVLQDLSHTLVALDGFESVKPNHTSAFEGALTVPKHIPATVLSEVITSTYELRLSVRTEHATAAGISIPIVVNDPQPLIVPFPTENLAKQWHMTPVRTLASVNSGSAFITSK